MIGQKHVSGIGSGAPPKIGAGKLSRRHLLTTMSATLATSVLAKAQTEGKRGSQRKTYQSIKIEERTLPFRGYHTWFRAVGERRSHIAPLLVAHGGPGFPHDYLTPLEELAGNGRQIIFYDQIGCGNSSRPSDRKLWSVQFFMDELQNLVQTLDLSKYSLLGQSWGGMLAMNHAILQPKQLESLIVSNSPASIPEFIEGTKRLRKELPDDVRSILDKHEKEGTTASKEYAEASDKFYARHVCRLNPWPEYAEYSLLKAERAPEVYDVMNGPSEFYITGLIKDFDITSKLKKILVPTLVLGGRYDEVTPKVTATVHKNIPGSEYRIFENSSHFPFIEEKEKFLSTVDTFLRRVSMGYQP